MDMPWKAGSAYIFGITSNSSDSTPTASSQTPALQLQKLVASDRRSDDLFGYSVSISGNYAIVGAYQEGEDASGYNSLWRAGSAYIFERKNEYRPMERDTKVSSFR